MVGLKKREYVLVVIMVLIVAGYCAHRFIYMPKTNQLKALEEELAITEAEKLTAQSEIDEIPTLENLITMELQAAKGGAPLFFDNIPQENLIAFLVETEEGTDVSIDSYGFTPLGVSEIQPVSIENAQLFYELKQLVEKIQIGAGEAAYDEEGNQQSQDNSNTGGDLSTDNAAISEEIGRTTVGASFTATYQGLIRYMERLEAYEKEIIVTSLTASKQDESGQLSLDMTLDFYQLPKLFPHYTDKEFEKWKYFLPKGKSNPFVNIEQSAPAEPSADDNNNTGQVAQTNDSISFRNPDFILIARSATSGLPSMTMGYGPDETGETYVRCYSDTTEEVTLEITAENGKYYYSYTASSGGAYPQTGKAEFKPINEDIRFMIFSYKRVSEKDTNSTNITIINNTRLKVNWLVSGDDTERPRVTVKAG